VCKRCEGRAKYRIGKKKLKNSVIQIFNQYNDKNKKVIGNGRG
jgi:DNA-binding protein